LRVLGILSEVLVGSRVREEEEKVKNRTL